MIDTLIRVLGESQRSAVRRVLVLTGLYGIAEGIAVVGLIPAAQAIATGDTPGFWWTLSWMAVAGLLAWVLHGWSRMASYTLAMTALTSVHDSVGSHIATLPLGWFKAARAGEMSQLLVKGSFSLVTALAHMMSNVVVGTTSSLTLVVATYFFDWRLGLTLTACLPVVALAFWAGLRLLRSSEDRSREAKVEVNSRVIEFANAQQALRAFGQSSSYAPLEEALQSQRRLGRRHMWWSVPGLGIQSFGVQVIFSAILLTSVWFALDGSLHPIAAMALMVLGARFVQPMEEIGQYLIGIRPALADLGRMRDVLDTKPLPLVGDGEEPGSGGRVVFDDVKFGYEPHRRVLDGVSFTVEPGTMTALVGPSGSGKTTITRLMARFWDVESGTVSVGGVDVRRQTTEQLMSQLALVFQDVYLFDDTLEANIRLGRPTASTDEFLEAAELAGVTEIVHRLPDGWQTRVGEGGRALSGGERQRVSIARALLKRAPVVLFDEATSALDPENEHHVRRSMDTLRESATVVAIAHKLSTVVHADQIVVLGANGAVEQCGTHDDLIGQPGRYADFWAEREQAALWRLEPEDSAVSTV